MRRLRRAAACSSFSLATRWARSCSFWSLRDAISARSVYGCQCLAQLGRRLRAPQGLDDLTLRVQDERGRKTVQPVCRADRLRGVAQDRVLPAGVRDEIRRVVRAVVPIHADQTGLVAECLVEALEFRRLLPARFAPARPEVHEG